MRALVIGGGVAGIATAAWLSRYEAPYDWVATGGDQGGILRSVYNPIIDYPGVTGNTGADVAEALERWADALVDGPSAGTVRRIAKTADEFTVTIDDEERLYDIVVLATGTRRRTLEIPGEAALLGDRVLQSTSQGPERFAGLPVALIGGGDAAVEGSLNLAEAGASDVLVIARSDIKAQRHFVREMDAHPTIRVYENHVEATRFEAIDEGCRIHLDDGTHIDVAAAFVRIGVEPVVPEIAFDVERGRGGFFIVDGRCETSVSGLFVVGDLADTPLRSVATCVGDGARAGRSVAEALEIWTR